MPLDLSPITSPSRSLYPPNHLFVHVNHPTLIVSSNHPSLTCACAGSNNTVQYAAVQYVISSAVAELLKDPERRFTYVEMAFFARWYYEQTPEMQEDVKGLVASGQLDFVNGGWCMHDEAAAHYVAMVDQTTLGHAFLAREFGFQPRAGWQIDPFGHSATQAALLSHGAGFDALFFGRIDYQV